MTTILRSATTPAAGRVIRAVGGAAEAAASRERLAREQALREADEIVARARAEAAAIRAEAEQQGRAAGLAAAEQSLLIAGEEPIQRWTATLVELTSQLEQLRLRWLQRWESSVVPLALAIATRVVRRTVRAAPEITVELVRDSLELAASGGRVRVALHPEDFQALAAQVQQLVQQLGRLAEVEVLADETISAGGCRVTTEHGEIDQQIETQLARIAEELG